MLPAGVGSFPTPAGNDGPAQTPGVVVAPLFEPLFPPMFGQLPWVEEWLAAYPLLI
jgi:hypothetical protein